MIIQYFSGNEFRLIKSALSLLQVLDDLTEVEQLQRHLIERSHFPYLSHTQQKSKFCLLYRGKLNEVYISLIRNH